MKDEIENTRGIFLALARELKRICEKYQLTYFLHAGSLLGAVRHEGFIPWDDDMDFVLPRKDFERLIEISDKEIQAPFFLQTDRNTPSMVTFGRMRLRMDGTTGVQLSREIRETYHQGLAIDIAPLDCLNEPETREHIWKMQERYACLHYIKHYGIKGKKIRKLKRWKKRIYRVGAKLFSDQYIVHNLRKTSLRNGYLSDLQEGAWCIVSSECMGRYAHKALKQEWYQESLMLRFEEETFPAPVGYNDILTVYYGSNYMEIPPVDKRKGRHFSVMSTEISYVDFLKPYHDIFKDTEHKEIIIFGAGEMLRYYLEHTKKKYHPSFATDNDSKKWGKVLFGVPIEAPEKINELPPEKRHVIICSIYYKEIAQQLEAMGITEYYIFIQNTDWL